MAAWAFSRLYSLRQTVRGVLHDRLDRPMLVYALPLAIAELVNSALGQLNVIVLGKFRPAEDVGVYAAAAALAGAISFLRGAFDTVVAPIAAEAWQSGDRPRLAATIKLYSRTILTFAVPFCGLLVVGGPTLLALHGPGFVRGTTTLAILSVGHVLNASGGITGWVLLASGRSRTLLANNLAIFVLNVALCLLLVPPLGMIGAALASALSIAVIQVVMAIEAHFIARASPLSAGTFRLAVLGAALLAGELAADRALGGPPALRAGLVIVAGAAAFVGLAYALGRREDRETLAALLLLDRGRRSRRS
jgi:O-antigen/teichoic acid export membrane protein